MAIRADVSSARDVDRFITLAEHKFGKIDVLINNAGILGPSPMPLLLDYPEGDFLNMLRVNAMTPFLMMKRVLSLSQHQRWSCTKSTAHGCFT